MNLPTNRFPSGPVYDSGAEPQYICSTKDCGAEAWPPEEHHQCIVCKKRFCSDCLIVLGSEKYCDGCAKCSCGQPALISCDECGKLLCADHLAVSPVLTECKPCAETARVA